jgi:hypothetical protein
MGDDEYDDSDSNHPYTHCETGNLAGLKAAIHSDNFDNMEGQDLTDMLHIAVGRKHPRIVAYFMDEWEGHYFVDHLDSDDTVPLTALQKTVKHWSGSNSSDSKSRDILLLLLKHGASVSKKFPNGLTPLQVAQQNGQEELAWILASHITVCKHLSAAPRTKTKKVTCHGHSKEARATISKRVLRCTK